MMTLKQHNIIIAGGGTGGHLFPGIAIAESFMSKNPDNNILFVNSGRPFDRSILSKTRFRVEFITAEGIKGRGLWQKTRALAKLPMGIMESLRIIKKFKPDIIVGMGSYSSGPLIIGAWLSGIMIVLHEQNIIPGITNRFLSRFAKQIYISFEKTGKTFGTNKIRVTGNPVRKEISSCLQSPSYKDAEDHDKEKDFTVLILGGSQGAHSINMAVMDSLNKIKNKTGLNIIHQTGIADENLVKDAYAINGVSCTVQSFFEDMARQYKKADLIICRAGATTVAEVSVIGKGIIFVPFPHAADNHQVLNAQTLADEGAADIIIDDALTGDIIAEKIDYYYSNRPALAEMAEKAMKFGKPDAAEKIVDDCYRLLSMTNK